VIIFNYVPIYGILIAFKRFSPRLGILASPWTGLENFNRLFNTPNFFRILLNTVTLSVYSLFAGFPFPIILAICVNHSLRYRFKKFTQTITLAPYFLSTVIIIGLIIQLLDVRTGGFNLFLKILGRKPIDFMGSPALFPHIYVWSGIWQSTGNSAIIYISALAAVDPTYHEAAVIDGANMWQRIWHIDLSTIRPIVIIMFILSMGGILSGNFEKAYLMQNVLNINASEIINTYVYKVGLASSLPNYSFGTAIGLFQNVTGVILVLLVNYIANRISGEGMF
jgi:multiple sugar transport system permease protein/putative aldouronate transport system permease protein